MLLSAVPEIQGRSDAGVSATRSGQARPTSTIAAPPASSDFTAATPPRGAIPGAAPPAGRDQEPRRGDPRHDHQRHEHLRLEREPDAHACPDEPLRTPVL